QLNGHTPLSGAPSHAGAYTVLASFPATTDYAAATALANFTIAKATPTVSVTASNGQYGRAPPPISATVAGVSGTAGPQLEGVGLTLTYYSGAYSSTSDLTNVTPLPGAPSHVGSYTVEATFPNSSADYTGGAALANFTIA